MSGFRVVPEQLRATGSSLAQQSQDLAASLSGLQATVSGTGNPWGGDGPGTMFGQLYVAVLGQALESITSNVGQVAYAGDGLTAQAAYYAQVETGATEQLTSMAQTLGN